MTKAEYLKMFGWDDSYILVTAEEASEHTNAVERYPINDPNGVKNFGQGAFVIKPMQAAVPPPPPAPTVADDVTPPAPAESQEHDGITMSRVANLVKQGWKQAGDNALLSPDKQVFTYEKIRSLDNNSYIAFISTKPATKEELEPEEQSATVEQTQSALDTAAAAEKEVEAQEVKPDPIFHDCSILGEDYEGVYQRSDGSWISKEAADQIAFERRNKLEAAGLKEEQGRIYANCGVVDLLEIPLGVMLEKEFQSTKKIALDAAAEVEEHDRVAEEIAKKKDKFIEEISKAAQEEEPDPEPAPAPTAEWAETTTNGGLDGFFMKLSKLGFQQLNLSINRLEGGKFSVVVRPNNFSGDPAYDKLSPIVLTGTIDQLDKSFFEAINPGLKEVHGLMSNAEAFIANAKEKERKTKEAEERKKQVEKLVSAAKKYVDGKDYDISNSRTQTTTRKKWQTVLDLDPENEDALAGIKVLEEHLQTNGNTLL